MKITLRRMVAGVFSQALRNPEGAGLHAVSANWLSRFLLPLLALSVSARLPSSSLPPLPPLFLLSAPQQKG